MTKKQINWASQHDWFSHDQDDGSIVCVDTIVNIDGTVTKAAVVFSNFKELRDWAGY